MANKNHTTGDDQSDTPKPQIVEDEKQLFNYADKVRMGTREMIVVGVLRAAEGEHGPQTFRYAVQPAARPVVFPLASMTYARAAELVKG